MTLLEYINSMPPSEQDAFARRCGTTIGYMRQAAYGFRKCGESLAINIDRESNGAVSFVELRPDVDWHYVFTKRSAEKAAA